MSTKINNNELDPKIPSVDMGEGDDLGKALSGTSILSSVVDATDKLNPTKFWMFFMIALSLCLGMIIVFGGQYLTNEIKSQKEEIKLLQTKLDECPDKTLARFRQQQVELEELKNIVFSDNIKIDSVKRKSESTLERIKKIDKSK